MEINELDAINTKVTSYGANLLPVVKNRSNEEIKFLYDFGFRVFGENRLEDYKLHYSMSNDLRTISRKSTCTFLKKAIAGSRCEANKKDTWLFVYYFSYKH